MIRILDAEKVPLSEILARTEDTRDLSGTVAGIIAEVRKHGDEALRRYSREFPPGSAGGGGGEYPGLPPAAGPERICHQREARRGAGAEGDAH